MKQTPKEKIQERRAAIRELNSEINEIASCNMTDYWNLQHAIGTWDCKDSPLGLCVYDKEEDKSHDDCIFCHDPEERK